MTDFLNENRFSIHSNSKGNLLKTEYEKDGILCFAKTGRMQLRDFPGCWGIEPVIEVICFRLGKLMGLNIAEQELKVLSGKRYGKEITTLVSVSPDFRNGKSMVYLQAFYVRNPDNINLEALCRKVNGIDLLNMLAFDLIIMNEDRHNGNVAWLVNDNGNLMLTPIFDNGYSLLYDDIKGMINNYEEAARFCLCNSPLYCEGFSSAERLFAELSGIYEPTINFDVSDTELHSIIETTKLEYEIFRNECINNVKIPDKWWEQVEGFIKWRISHVRALRYNMEG